MAIKLAALAAMSGLTLLAGPAVAQSVTGAAFGSYVNALGVTTQSPVATLPTTGGYAVGEAETFAVPNAIDARWFKAVTTGAVGNQKSGSQSTSEGENISVLNGLIQADIVTAVATSYQSGLSAASDGTGSGFTNLVVNGVAITTEVAPNTRVDLPGVGYAVLNEQSKTGDGVSSSGITVNMIRVVMQDALTGLTTGEIVVGSASSHVTR